MSFTLLPKFKYLIAYNCKDYFKVECNRIKLPNGVQRMEPWSRLAEVSEIIRKTKMPFEELPSYVTEAQKFSLKKAESLPTELEGADFFGMLYDYQKQGVLWALRFNFNLALCDDMGLGKTLQALCIASIYMYRNKEKRPKMLILCPAFLCKDWEANVKKRLGAYESQIALLSYDTAKNKSKELKKEKFSIAICDEAHALKNSKSQRYRKLAPILKKLKAKLLLTGTPSTNKSIEYYSMLSVLWPKKFKTLKSFTERYWCKISRKARNSKELAFILPSMHFIRRSKEDVLNLPPKITTTVYYDDPEAKQAMSALIKKVEKEEDKGLVRYHIGGAFHDLASIKARSDALCSAYKNYLKENLPEKILVFCQHLDVLGNAEAWAKEIGVKRIEVIHGGVSTNKRNIIVHAFQAGQVDMLCCTIPAAGVGLTLTMATRVLFLELSWQRGMVQQAVDRAHRISQTKTVYVTQLICRSSLDEWILKSVTGKKKMQTLLLAAARKMEKTK